jgi:hypothetical protein
VININQCAKILNQGERKYSIEDVKAIREYLYQLGKIQIEEENGNTSNSVHTSLVR